MNKIRNTCSLFISAYSFESDILSSEPPEVKSKLEKWLPKVGVWQNCWRATRDVWTGWKFLVKCHSTALKLTVVKAEQDNVSLILGGYTTAGWSWRWGKFFPDNLFLHDNQKY